MSRIIRRTQDLKVAKRIFARMTALGLHVTMVARGHWETYEGASWRFYADRPVLSLGRKWCQLQDPNDQTEFASKPFASKPFDGEDNYIELVGTDHHSHTEYLG
jgi:hypothetical protein